MARLSGPEIALVAEAAGFEGDALVTALAIAKAESGWRDDARGDEGLTDDKWGPSLGLWQIRSLKAQTGTGQTRDAEILTLPLPNARSAFAISGGGTNWQPWSVWWRDAQRRIGPGQGPYRRHLDDARAAVASLDDARDQGPDRQGGGWVPGIPDPGDAIDRVGSTVDVIAGPVRWISDPDNWRRIGLFVAGIALAYLGVAMILGDTALDVADDVAAVAA